MKITKEAKIGILTVSALATVYLGLNFLKGQQLTSANTYCVVYENSGGLKSGSRVFVNGLAVGAVKKIEILPEEQYSSRITFTTQRNIILTEASKAKLVNVGLLGGKAIELLIRPGQPLKNYATVSSVVEPGIGETLTETAIPVFNDAKEISLLANKFLANLAENTGKINAIFTNLEEVTQRLKQTIAANEIGINALNKNLGEVANALSHRKEGIRPLLTQLNHLAHGIQGADQKVNNILDQVEQLIDKTNTGKNSLSKLVSDDTLYKNLNQTLVDLDQLLLDLQAHPWRYVNFSLIGNSSRD